MVEYELRIRRRGVHPNPSPSPVTSLHRPARAIALSLFLALAGITAADDDPGARSQAARRRLGLGDTAGAVEAFRRIARDHPCHAPTRRLVDTLDRLASPAADPGGPPRDLPGRWHVALGPHVRLLHRGRVEEAEARVALLERVMTTYYLLLTDLGFDLPAPRTRLSAIRCDDPAEFRAILAAWGASALGDDWGCYLPARHVVLTRAPRATSSAEVGLETSAAAHELVHQLAAESGLEPRPGAFPSWLAEGLAAQFEPADGPRWLGPAGPNHRRLADCRRGDPSPRLAPMLADPAHARPAYGPAWALVHLLLAEEPAALAALIDRLRGPDADSSPLDTARRALGDDLAPLERRWRVHMRGGFDPGPLPALDRPAATPGRCDLADHADEARQPVGRHRPDRVQPPADPAAPEAAVAPAGDDRGDGEAVEALERVELRVQRHPDISPIGRDDRRHVEHHPVRHLPDDRPERHRRLPTADRGPNPQRREDHPSAAHGPPSASRWSIARLDPSRPPPAAKPPTRPLPLTAGRRAVRIGIYGA